MAEKLCDTIERTGKVGGKEIAGVRALHLKLRMDRALRPLYHYQDLDPRPRRSRL